MGEQLLVPFAGEGSGVGELSWGQQAVWRGIELRGAPIIILGVSPLPEGTTVEDVAGDLAFLMSRHQSLRTRFRRSGDGRMQQVVADRGEIPLAVVDAADDADPREVADALGKEYEFGDRDYASEWPMRLGVVRHRGVPVYRVMAICHMATDGFGGLTMLDDLAARDRVTGQPKGPMTAMPPLEQASRQASPAGQRQSVAAQRHWDRVLRTIPPRRFAAESPDKRKPRFWEASYNSPAAYLAIQSIAARTRLDTSPVLLAAFAAGLTRVTGINPAVLRVMVSNRFRPRFAESVSPVSQTCPCVVDVAGITFDEAATRAWRASVAAYKNAYFEPVKIRELVESVSKERGEEIDLGLVYNDRRMETPRAAPSSAAGAIAGPAELRAALPRTTMRWEDPSDEFLDLCHIHVFDSPDAVNVTVIIDTHYVSPGDTEAFLREMEAVTVEAAFDPSAPTGV